MYRKERGFKMAEELSDFINSATNSDKLEFIESITSDHRALQSEFFYVFFNCIKEVGFRL